MDLLVRRIIAALVVSATSAAAQTTGAGAWRGSLAADAGTAVSLQPARIAGEMGAGMVGFALGAEVSFFTSAGIANLVRGHGGDITTPGLRRLTTAIVIAGGGVGAGTSAWLVSRADRQSSSYWWDVGAATAATAVAFKWAGWPMTESSRRRPMSRLRRMAPVWMSAMAATWAASATRTRR